MGRRNTGFRLVPNSMTLNDLQRHNSPYFLPNSTDFQADYVTVVEYTPIMSVKYCRPPSSSLPLLAKTITHPAARSLR